MCKTITFLLGWINALWPASGLSCNIAWDKFLAFKYEVGRLGSCVHSCFSSIFQHSYAAWPFTSYFLAWLFCPCYVFRWNCNESQFSISFQSWGHQLQFSVCSILSAKSMLSPQKTEYLHWHSLFAAWEFHSSSWLSPSNGYDFWKCCWTLWSD